MVYVSHVQDFKEKTTVLFNYNFDCKTFLVAERMERTNFKIRNFRIFQLANILP